MFERHEPEPEHTCTVCGKAHSSSSRTEPWYSFKHDAIRESNTDHEAMSALMENEAPDMEAGYEWTVTVLDAIAEGSITDEDSLIEWADSATPVYTYDLAQWFARSVSRLDLITDMLDEYGIAPNDGAGSLLMRAYCFGLERYALAVWRVLVDRKEDHE